MLDSFYTETLPNYFKERSTVIGDYSIEHSLVPITSLDIQESEGTEFIRLVDNLSVDDLRRGERLNFLINIIDIPHKTYAGFKIKGINRQMADLYEMSKGWHFEVVKSKSKSNPDPNGAKSVKFVADTSMSAMGYHYRFGVSKGSIPSVSLFYKKNSVPISYFLKALTGDTFVDILRKIGTRNNYIMNAFACEEYTRLQCIEKCYISLFGKEPPVMDDRFKIQDFCSKFVGYSAMIGNGSGRMSDLFAFRTHLKNYILARPLRLGKELFPVGTKLLPDLLLEIDYSEVDEISVQQPGGDKVFTFRKYDIYNFRGLNRTDGLGASLEELMKAEEEGRMEFPLSDDVVLRRKDSPICNTPEVFYNVINLYTNFLSGFELNSDVYNLENQSLISVDNAITNSIYERLSYINQKVSELQDSSQSAFVLRNLVLKINPFELSTLINKIARTADRSVQLASLTNSVALSAKAYNVVKDMKFQQSGTVQIQPTQIGRLDPFDVPENANVGLTHNRTITSKVGKNNQILAPYLRVENCQVVSTNPIYFTASDERNQYIGEWNETFTGELTTARYNGMVMMVPPSKLNYIEFSPYQHMSLPRAMAPFPENMAGKRAQMEASHVKQAIAVCGSERAIVNSGAESLQSVMDNVTKPMFTADDLLAEYCANSSHKFEEIKGSTLRYIGFSDNMEDRTFNFSFNYGGLTVTFSKRLPAFHPTFEKSMYGYVINKHLGLEFTGNDIVLHTNTYDPCKYKRDDRVSTGGLSVSDDVFDSGTGTGVNLRIGYMTFGGSSIDDAIVISDRLVSEDLLSSVYLWQEEFELVKPDEKKREEFGYYDGEIPPGFSSLGIPEVGTHLAAGAVVVHKFIRRLARDGSLSTAELNPTNAELPATVSGEVIGSMISGNKAIVTLVSLAKIEPGDKMAGRFGNKGVIGRLVPYHQMPYDPITGETLDVVLNPLGIPSRINISQVLEVFLAAANKRQNCISVVTPFQDNSVEYIKDKCKESNIVPQQLVFGETGISVDGYIVTGYMYMYKLMQKVSDRINSVGFTTEVDPTFHQPTGGGKSGAKGQAFGEMENWSLDSAEAYVLQHELQTVLSDDRAAIRLATLLALEDPNSIDIDPSQSYTNNNDSNLFTFLTSSGIRVEQDVEDPSMLSYKPLTDDYIKALNPTKPVNINDPINSLRSPTIFGERYDSGDVWSWMYLGGQMIHPFWLFRGNISKLVIINKSTVIKDSKLNKLFDNKEIDELLRGNGYLEKQNSQWFLGYTTKNTRRKLDFEKVEAALCKINGLRYEEGKWFIDAVRQVTTAPMRLIEIQSVMQGLQFLEERESGWFLLDEPTESSISGMDGMVTLFQKYNLEFTRSYYDSKCNGSSKKKKKMSLSDLQILNSIDSLISEGGLSQYIVSCMPIMPIRFRPASVIPNVQQDFDYMYSAIAASAATYVINKSPEAMYKTFRFYAGLLGVLGKKNTPFKKRGKANVDEDRTYVDNRRYWSEKDSGGRIREKVAKKYTHRSGRSVLIPFQDVSIGPDRLGIPYIIAINLWQLELTSLVIRSLPEVFNGDPRNHSNKAYSILKNAVLGNEAKVRALCAPMGQKGQRYCFHIKSLISKFVCSKIVIFGRQPTLHKFSIRAYRPILVEGRALQIHPLSCKGFNADFDGDTGYVIAPISEAAQKNAWDKLAIENGVVDPGTGNLIVEPSQDMLIGMYYATSFKENAVLPGEEMIDQEKVYRIVEPVGYSNLNVLLADLDLDYIKPYTWVTVSHNKRMYIATAGRIAFNALIPDGFTKSPYVNKYNLPVKFGFSQLRFDGVVTGRVTNPELQISASEIFKLIYDEYTSADRYGSLLDSNNSDDVDRLNNARSYDKSRIVFHYQKLSEFGFKWSERSGLTFSLDDLKQPKIVEEFLDSAERVTAEIDRQFQMGLLSESGRKNAVMQIYETIGTKDFKKKFISSLGRKNNLFIMYDSKARGSDDQIMQTCGLLGVLQKTKDSAIDKPITRNYTNGLSSFDLFETSYSTRLGLLSTILETSKPGELTRTLIYEFSGLVVSTESEGPNIPPLTIDYVVDSDFITLNGKSSSLHEIIGTRITDDVAIKYAKNFSPDGLLTAEVFESLRKSGLPWFDIELGRVEFETSFPEIWAKLLLYRTANDSSYPGLIRGRYISAETIKYFEEVRPRFIHAFTLLNCVADSGVSADSYGLRYDPIEPVNVGDFLGSEAAQSIGAPSAQLTMSLFHKAGKAGESIEDGITLIKSAMQYANIKINNPCHCSPTSGYIKMKGRSVNVVSEEGVLYSFPQSIDSDLLLVSDGEYVRVGQKLTKGNIHPLNSFVCQTSFMFDSPEEFDSEIRTNSASKRCGILNPGLDLITKIRFELTAYYLKTYKANGIDLHGRHFEIPAFLQTNTVTVIRNDAGSPMAGSKCSYGTAYKLGNIDFYLMLGTASDIILNNAGGIAAFCYQDAYAVLGKAAFSRAPIRERSTLSTLLTGSNLTNPGLGIKNIMKASVDPVRLNSSHAFNFVRTEPISQILNISMKEIQSNTDNVLLDFGPDLDDLVVDNKVLPQEKLVTGVDNIGNSEQESQDNVIDSFFDEHKSKSRPEIDSLDIF